jgi:O-antigen ligase
MRGGALRRAAKPSRLATGAIVLLPGALTAYASFQAGGFFAGTPALLAVVMGVLLVLRVTLAEEPFAGFGRWLGVAVCALGLYAAWILLSTLWSEAPARAVIDFDRALLYWFALVMLGTLPWTRERVEWAVRGVVLAMLVVCGVALVTRLFPDAIDIAPGLARERLNYPITYWNALGLMAAIAIVFCTHFASSERESAFVRVIGAGALPLLATTLYFTFSRGAVYVVAGALIVYVVVARPRALPVALLTVAPGVAVALSAAYGADELASERPTTPAAAAEGEDVAVVLATCIAAVIAARALALFVDRRVREIAIAGPARRALAFGAAAVVALGVVVSIAAFDAVGKVQDRIEGFSDQNLPIGTNVDEVDLRDRLAEPGNNERLHQWGVALNGFEESPLTGDGAGKFSQRWSRERNNDLKVEDAHSLYVESLGELGLIGTLFLVTAIVSILAACLFRARGPDRHLYAAVLAAGLAWALHAGIDWDWEMPAVTAWFFGVGGVALASRSGSLGWVPSRMMRVGIGVAVLALLALPAGMALSQRPLNESVQALKVGDCERVIDRALASARAMPVRPEPYELLAWCDWRLGDRELALRMADAAVARDPEWWEPYYTRALIKAASGRDPRDDARRAFLLNPLDPLARDGFNRFRTKNRRDWERLAEEARLPVL